MRSPRLITVLCRPFPSQTTPQVRPSRFPNPMSTFSVKLLKHKPSSTSTTKPIQKQKPKIMPPACFHAPRNGERDSALRTTKDRKPNHLVSPVHSRPESRLLARLRTSFRCSARLHRLWHLRHLLGMVDRFSSFCGVSSNLDVFCPRTCFGQGPADLDSLVGIVASSLGLMDTRLMMLFSNNPYFDAILFKCCCDFILVKGGFNCVTLRM